MGHAKTKVVVSCLNKSRLYQRTVSRNEIYVSVKGLGGGGGHIKLSLLVSLSPLVTLSLSLSCPHPLSLSSLSLSNTTRIYWNVVVFAFQGQFIQRLFAKNNIDASLLLCTLYSIFRRESYVSPVIFSTLSALISMNELYISGKKLQKKSFYGICRMRNWLRVAILWCNIICTIKW